MDDKCPQQLTKDNLGLKKVLKTINIVIKGYANPGKSKNKHEIRVVLRIKKVSMSKKVSKLACEMDKQKVHKDDRYPIQV